MKKDLNIVHAGFRRMLLLSLLCVSTGKLHPVHGAYQVRNSSTADERVFQASHGECKSPKSIVLLDISKTPAVSEPPSPKARILGSLLLTGGLISGVGHFDRQINRRINPSALKGELGEAMDEGDVGRYGSLLEMIGRPETAIGMAGLIYAGGVFGSERARRVGVLGAEATAASGFLALGIKNVVGRNRPDHRNDPDRIRFLNGKDTYRTSFPSGHTTTAFTLAAVVADECDSLWIDILSYGMASAVGFSRVYQQRHWASDVVGGAALGIAVGKGFSRLEKTKGWNRWLYADGQGLYLKRKF